MTLSRLLQYPLLVPLLVLLPRASSEAVATGGPGQVASHRLDSGTVGAENLELGTANNDTNLQIM